MSDRINIDLSREKRLGFPEAVFGLNKDVESLLDIIRVFRANGKSVLITRLQKEKFEKIDEKYPGEFYDELSGVCVVGEFPETSNNQSVGVISAGTTDAYVVNEVYYTLKYHGIKADRIHDIGISGIHRLLSRLDEIGKYQILIVIAGFEGALPTVIGGLLPQPLIAVPTSIGYGVAQNGHVALNAMLTSCANGISVVNIDNGYGAAMAAFRILHAFNGIKQNNDNRITG
ncbi:MAG: nickel pincer cofactor biosynthesis protein LarB [Cyclobacteriaceae bacterium]|nr:nickel pincer cofactor biosynthesis protein LarB [Cyclobacteriaceae bacterium]